MHILPFYGRRSPAQDVTNQKTKVPFLISTAQNMYDSKKGGLAWLVSRRVYASGPTQPTYTRFCIIKYKAFLLFIVNLLDWTCLNVHILQKAFILLGRKWVSHLPSPPLHTQQHNVQTVFIARRRVRSSRRRAGFPEICAVRSAWRIRSDRNFHRAVLWMHLKSHWLAICAP